MAAKALVITKMGYGKLVDPSEFREQKRGGGGVTGYKVTEDSGPVAAVIRVETGMAQRVLIYTAMGRAILTPVDDISERSRSAGGVKLINLQAGDKVVGAAF